MQINNWLTQYWWVVLAASLFLYNVINGLKTGDAVLLFTRVKRSKDPLLYWFAIVFTGAAFVIAILIVVFLSNTTKK